MGWHWLVGIFVLTIFVWRLSGCLAAGLIRHSFFEILSSKEGWAWLPYTTADEQLCQALGRWGILGLAAAGAAVISNAWTYGHKVGYLAEFPEEMKGHSASR